MVSNYPLDRKIDIIKTILFLTGMPPPDSLLTGPNFFNSNSTEEPMINQGVNHPTQINGDRYEWSCPLSLPPFRPDTSVAKNK
ncbi:MAG: hypothetical protein ACXVZU_06070 [Methanobacteriaceae archaeon]